MKANSLRSPLRISRLNPDFVSILLVTIVWMAMLVLINPIGNFPLNDDWAYGWTVKMLLETGEYQLSDWTATNLLSQVVWGAIFCLPFGFSFTVLRVSTLVLGLLGVLASYGLLRELTGNFQLALLGASVIALNPVYFSSSNSFNSDVPSFSFAILSLYFIVRGLRLNSNLEVLAGILISFIAILNRQSSIVITASFGLAYLAKKGLKIKNFTVAFLPTITGLLLQAGYSHWLNSVNETPALYGFQIKNLLETFSKGLVTVALTYLENAIIILVYLGLFLFPFLIVCLADRFKSLSFRNRRLDLLVILLFLASGTVLVLQGRQMPFVGNTLETFGVGPEAFDGYSSSLNAGGEAIWNRTWELLTLIGFIGAAVIILYLIPAFLDLTTRWKEDTSDQGWLPILAISAAFIYFVVIGGLNKQYWFDRYLLFLMPILMMLIIVLSKDSLGEKLPSGMAFTASALLLVYGSFTVAATHDYLLWNRVRWQALNSLIEDSKVLPEQIYGGFEFNGWHFANRLETCEPQQSNIDRRVKVDWSSFTCLWGENTGRFKYLYKLRFITESGWMVKQQYSFRRWLLGDGTLYVLEQRK